jgi:hypothetical protein
MQVRPATLAAATAVAAAEEIRRIVAERCGVYRDLIVTDRKQIERRSPSAVNDCASAVARAVLWIFQTVILAPPAASAVRPRLGA